MRYLSFFCMMVVVLLSGCRDNSADSESSSRHERTDPVWEYEYDPTANDFRIVKLRELSHDTLTVPLIEAIVNTAWPKVQVKYLKTSKDTVFLTIERSEVLTQQMGSEGAQQFLISATFTFTELKGVNYVSYTFPAGDHAEAGVYSRRSWTFPRAAQPAPLN